MKLLHNSFLLFFLAAFSFVAQAQISSLDRKGNSNTLHTTTSEKNVEVVKKEETNTTLIRNFEGRSIEIDKQGVQSLSIPKPNNSVDNKKKNQTIKK